MNHLITKVQPVARASLAAALGIVTWLGVAAMAFGLASWFGAVLAGAEYARWIARLMG